MMRVPYDERLAPIDEQIAKLIAERMQISKGTNGHPTKEQFERWCEAYQLDRNLLMSVFQAMNHTRRPPRLPADPQYLLNIVPIMRKTIIDEITYQVTRMEQYEEFSLVYVEIYTSGEAESIELNPQLILHVKSTSQEQPHDDLDIQIYRIHSQPNRKTIIFMARPHLSDDISTYEFQLIPYAVLHHPRLPERLLDQPVQLR